MLQVVTGVAYLQKGSGDRKPIIHYDLKPGNILFDGLGDAKITDFGLSKILEQDDIEMTSMGAGTYWYLPPECFSRGSRISGKVDVWSLGVIFYQMLYGRRPFGHELSQDKIFARGTIGTEELKFPEDVKVSKEGRGWIEKCLCRDVGMRWGIEESLECEYWQVKKL